MNKSHFIIFCILTLIFVTQQTVADDSNSSSNKRTGSIYQGYYTLETARGPYEACLKFKETNTPYTQFLDQKLEENFQKFENMYLERMKAKAECLKLPIEEQNVFKQRAKDNYKDSDNAYMYKMGVAMVIAGHDNVEKFVDGCNTFSQSYSLLYSESKEEKLDTVTCEYRK